MHWWQDRFDPRLGAKRPMPRQHSEKSKSGQMAGRWTKAKQDQNPVSQPRRFSWEDGE